MKYYETLACNTLVLASASQELTDLGFINGETFVAVDETDFREKSDYYLHHEQERLAIAQKGYEMIQNRHTTKQRAKELLQHIQRIVNQK